MEPFEYEGVFWAADEPGRRLAGRLSYSATEGATLRLVGSFFSDLQAALQSIGTMEIRINGAAGGKILTLERCLLRDTTLQSGDVVLSEYVVAEVFSGVQFHAGEEISFDDLWIRFDQLSYWVNRHPFAVSSETTIPNDFSTETRTSITYEIQPAETVQTQGAEVSLGFAHTIGGDNVTEMRIGHQALLGLHYPEARSFAEILMDINGLQDLITLAIDAPTVPTEITLRRSDLTREDRAGAAIPVPISFFSANLAEYVRRDRSQMPSDMLFTFDQIGGIQTVARWVAVSRQYRLVLGFLLTVMYSARLYEENRYSNVISAAETYHRMRFPNEARPKTEFKSYRKKIVRAVAKGVGSKAANWVGDQLLYSNEPRLRMRLSQLANHPGSAFTELIGDIDTWTSVVTMARNRFTHHDEQQPFEREHGDLLFLADSVYVLVLLCIFKECGVPDDVLVNIQGNGRIRFTQNKLQEIIPRLSKFTRRA
jgi:hypothetical protein